MYEADQLAFKAQLMWTKRLSRARHGSGQRASALGGKKLKSNIILYCIYIIYSILVYGRVVLCGYIHVSST